jgi:hypothetical protein
MPQLNDLLLRLSFTQALLSCVEVRAPRFPHTHYHPGLGAVPGGSSSLRGIMICSIPDKTLDIVRTNVGLRRLAGRLDQLDIRFELRPDFAGLYTARAGSAVAGKLDVMMGELRRLLVKNIRSNKNDNETVYLTVRND